MPRGQQSATNLKENQVELLALPGRGSAISLMCEASLVLRLDTTKTPGPANDVVSYGGGR